MPAPVVATKVASLWISGSTLTDLDPNVIGVLLTPVIAVAIFVPWAAMFALAARSSGSSSGSVVPSTSISSISSSSSRPLS